MSSQLLAQLWLPYDNNWCFQTQHLLEGTPLDTHAQINIENKVLFCIYSTIIYTQLIHPWWLIFFIQSGQHSCAFWLCDSSPLWFHVEFDWSLSEILVNKCENFVSRHIFVFTAAKLEVTLCDVWGEVCWKYCQVNHRVPVGATFQFSPCCALSDPPSFSLPAKQPEALLKTQFFPPERG